MKDYKLKLRNLHDHTHWVGRGTGNLEVIGDPSRLRLIRNTAAFARILPHI